MLPVFVTLPTVLVMYTGFTLSLEELMIPVLFNAVIVACRYSSLKANPPPLIFELIVPLFVKVPIVEADDVLIIAVPVLEVSVVEAVIVKSPLAQLKQVFVLEELMVLAVSRYNRQATIACASTNGKIESASEITTRVQTRFIICITATSEEFLTSLS